MIGRTLRGKIMHAKLPALVTGLVIAISAIAPSSANMAPPPEVAAENSIRSVDADMQAAVAAKDAEKVATFYAADATVLPPGAPPIEGRDGIVAFWKAFLATPGLKLTWEFTRVKVAESGDVAVAQGPYTMEMGEGTAKTTEQGKSVVTWVMTQEGWRMYTDMFSPNGPTPPPSAESTPPPPPEKAQ
jgi:uncharacterized protein (TIGR02246 family)